MSSIDATPRAASRSILDCRSLTRRAACLAVGALRAPAACCLHSPSRRRAGGTPVSAQQSCGCGRSPATLIYKAAAAAMWWSWHISPAPAPRRPGPSISEPCLRGAPCRAARPHATPLCSAASSRGRHGAAIGHIIPCRPSRRLATASRFLRGALVACSRPLATLICAAAQPPAVCRVFPPAPAPRATARGPAPRRP